jgi:spermidine/putrescine transport system permease protein
MLKTISSTIYLIFLILLVLLPLAIIITYSFSDIKWHFTLGNFKEIFYNPNYIKIIFRSIKVAILTTIWVLILGYPVAYFICKIKNSCGKNNWRIVIISPKRTKLVLINKYLVKILGENGLLNGFFSIFGDLHFHFLYNEGAIIFGMVYNFLPFMIFPIYNALIKIDSSYIDAAKDLGAPPFKTFYKIILPLSLHGVKSGIFLVLIPSITVFAISDLLGGAKNMLFGNLINQSFFYLRNWHLGCAIALLLIIMFILFYVLLNYRALFRKIRRKNELTTI